VLALLAALLLWVLFGVLRGAIELWQQWRGLPGWAQVAVALLVAAAVSGIAWAGIWLLRPRRREPCDIAPPTRAQVEQRIDALKQRHADTAELQAELHELDRRARAEEFYVAVFGEISTGKSSVIRALAPKRRHRWTCSAARHPRDALSRRAGRRHCADAGRRAGHA
jgi:hypothetical protein